MDHSPIGFPVLHHLPELPQAHVHWISDAIQPFVVCHPLLFLSSIFPSITVFSNELCVHIWWPKYWSFNLVLLMNIQDWFPLRLTDMISLQPKGLSWVFFNTTAEKKSILMHSAFFMVQLSHPYMTTAKTIALTIQSFVGEVMSLLFNMLFRLVIIFLPRSKCLLIPCLWSLPAMILELEKLKSFTVSVVSPSICLKWWDWMPWF